VRTRELRDGEILADTLDHACCPDEEGAALQYDVRESRGHSVAALALARALNPPCTNPRIYW